MVTTAELMSKDNHVGPGPQQALVVEPAEAMMAINAMGIPMARIAIVGNMVLLAANSNKSFILHYAIIRLRFLKAFFRAHNEATINFYIFILDFVAKKKKQKNHQINRHKSTKNQPFPVPVFVAINV